LSGRHRGPKGSLRTPIAIAAAVSLVAVGAVVIRAVAADARGCSSDTRLTIAAAPDIEPAVREIADRWTSTNPKVNGDCVNVEVHAAEPADVANMLATGSGGSINVAATPAPTPSDSDIPAVWIPDSSAWIARMQGVNKDLFDVTTRSIALSPVTFAMPEALARTVAPDPKPHIGAPEIFNLAQKLSTGGLKLGAVEPRRDTAGLVGAALLKDTIVTDPSNLIDMVKVFRVVDVAPNDAALLKSFGPNEIAPMSEQAVLAHDRGAPAVTLAAVPTDPSIALDYPYAELAGKSRDTDQAADQFLGALTADANRDVLWKAGFRAPDGKVGEGFPAGHGATTAPAIAQPFGDAGRINDVLGYWTATKSASRVLTLVDVTSSMNQPITLHSGVTTTRLDLLRKTASDGLKLFTDDSQLGLWAFAAGGPGDPDYQELAPVETLNAAQRTRLNDALNASAVAPTDVTGLYSSVLAAYTALRDTYRADRSNTVVVFTDGSNSKPGMTLEQFETALEEATDPTRPVRVVLLGIGPDVNQAELNDIAARTGGRAFSVQDPEQIGNIFLEALLRPGS
jgi:Ca-activated chloride channel homolog